MLNKNIKINIGDRIRVVDLTKHPSGWPTTGVVSEVIGIEVYYKGKGGDYIAYLSEIEVLNKQLLFDFMKGD